MKPLFAILALVPSLVWAESYSPYAPSAITPPARRRLSFEGLEQNRLPQAAPIPGRSMTPSVVKDGEKCAITHCTFDKSKLDPWEFSQPPGAPLNGPFGPGDQERLGPNFSRDPLPVSSEESWTGGLSRLRVPSSEGTIDYGSAVCVGYGRQSGEWTFLSCSHNLESGGVPELFVCGEWIEAKVLYRDELAEAVKTGPGQYVRVSAGPDRSVLTVRHPGPLPFRSVSLDRYTGPVALSGFPSTSEPVVIGGRTRPHPSFLSAALERPSQAGFSGGGVFNKHSELIGIWTSGSKGTGYGHYVSEFVPIFQQLGWAPENWPALPGKAGEGETVSERTIPSAAARTQISTVIPERADFLR